MVEYGMSVEDLLDGEETGRAWAVRCVAALGLDGIAVSLRDGLELVWYSDDTSAWLDDIQFVLGEGPGASVDPADAPLQVADLDAHLGPAALRWPRFTAEARTAGVRAVFVWPLGTEGLRFGTFSGYRATPGSLTPRQAADGHLVAEAMALRILAWRPDNESSFDEPRTAGTIGLHRAEVHQAVGALSYQLGVPLEEARAHLRAQALASAASLPETARAVLRELRT
ncbi:hypothetical protein [Streptomyces sp. CRN 30]|uniref:hypothetical protein n=1 Tax=Streptomyces sp. CRN 30 TaxID=3075613 RepID=UPI002A836480|nr:hypothetical protein [Streptomyces sp. CRN 30]